ncbi:MAG TPA: UDP-glucose/GDP-mannose dehydrogenase family protein [Methanothrix sp.]|nr:UDP-glucose/GDP-mannose dehydrogenase family protein [Methanothrix sp.]HOK58247.1 UDP-glucose/GDP-mannose dehydrogenase family protein [Methanothrix sp.]HOL43571.1 UDP-glucose/GDP-mannose dehydrogenase family protein [Methanothrix sp.]HPO89140.1 UDP-glucose/GDP-mannose dehydrogenase family protein [Methanothrix sp.]
MRISVIGGGYVGLVSAVCFAELGHSVDLVEIDRAKCDAINAGHPPIYENGLEELLSAHAGKNLHAYVEYDHIKYSDIIFICVGTPQGPDGHPDLSNIISSSESIGRALRDTDDTRYHVVVVKSTVPPGTTEKQVIPSVLRQSGKKNDKIGFAVNPEFLREGMAVWDFMNPDRIVIGCRENRVGDLVEAAYSGIKAPVIRTGIAAAEMIKYASNAFLATKISYANEIGNICKKLGIDVYEVMRAVGRDSRIGPAFLNAGTGFGGSCLPKDVSALIALAEDLGENPVLLKSVMHINKLQPLRLIDLLIKRVGDLDGKKISVLGLSFKENTDDVRESRSVVVIKELISRGARVSAYDPRANQSMKRILPEVDYCSSASESLTDADACLVMTEWPEFAHLDKEFDLMKSRVIIEGRRILSCKDREGICW